MNTQMLKLMALALLLISSAVMAEDIWTRSYTLETNEQYIEAAKTIEQFLDKPEQSEFTQLRSGWLYYLAGNYSRSIKHYQTALKMNNKSLEARLGLSLPLLAQSRWKEAAIQCNAVIKLSSWNYYAHVRLMVSEEGQKQWGTLVKHAEELNQRYPADATVLVYLARGYKQQGEKTKARSAYNQVLSRVPGHLEASQFMVE